jgi:hypothetical protein
MTTRERIEVCPAFGRVGALSQHSNVVLGLNLDRSYSESRHWRFGFRVSWWSVEGEFQMQPIIVAVRTFEQRAGWTIRVYHMSRGLTVKFPILVWGFFYL